MAAVVELAETGVNSVIPKLLRLMEAKVAFCFALRPDDESLSCAFLAVEVLAEKCDPVVLVVAICCLYEGGIGLVSVHRSSPTAGALKSMTSSAGASDLRSTWKEPGAKSCRASPKFP